MKVKLWNILNRKFDGYYTKSEFVSVVIIILLSKSLYYESFGENFLLFPLAFYLAHRAYKVNVKIKLKLIVYTIGLLSLILINPDANYNSVAVLVIRTVIAILIVSLISFKSFSFAFIDVMRLISLFSLFSLIFIILQIPSPLPNFIATDERELFNYIFFSVSELDFDETNLVNTGLWWEPGAFQIFVNLAFLFAIVNEVVNKNIFILFFLTILTTGSTSGIICFALLSSAFFSQKFLKKNGLIYIISLGITLFTLYFAYGNEILNKVFYKSEESFSFISRATDLTISYELFKENLIMGYGFANVFYQEKETALRIINDQVLKVEPTGADGITMYIAQLGILSFLFLIPFLWPKYLDKFNILQKVLILISLVVLFNSQNFTFILIFNILTYYGLLKRENKSALYVQPKNNYQ